MKCLLKMNIEYIYIFISTLEGNGHSGDYLIPRHSDTSIVDPNEKMIKYLSPRAFYPSYKKSRAHNFAKKISTLAQIELKTKKMFVCSCQNVQQIIWQGKISLKISPPQFIQKHETFLIKYFKTSRKKARNRIWNLCNFVKLMKKKLSRVIFYHRGEKMEIQRCIKCSILDETASELAEWMWQRPSTTMNWNDEIITFFQRCLNFRSFSTVEKCEIHDISRGPPPSNASFRINSD